MIVTVAPAFTDRAENENPEMVITGPVAAGGDVAGADAVDELEAAPAGADGVWPGVEALEHDAIVSATTATAGPSAKTRGCLMLDVNALWLPEVHPRAGAFGEEVLLLTGRGFTKHVQSLR